MQANVLVNLWESKSTSDAGTQYRCGRVGRGSQPPSTPNAPPNPLPNTDTNTNSFENARFPTRAHGRMYGRRKPPIELCVRNLKVKEEVTRPDTRPSVADGWAGADMRVFPLFDSMVTDGRTNRPTDQPTDGQSLL